MDRYKDALKTTAVEFPTKFHFFSMICYSCRLLLQTMLATTVLTWWLNSELHIRTTKAALA